MSEKSTKELADILGKTHLSEFDQYCKDHKESMKAGKDMFSIYIKNILSEKGMTQQAVFLKADIRSDTVISCCREKSIRSREMSFCGSVMRRNCLWQRHREHCKTMKCRCYMPKYREMRF